MATERRYPNDNLPGETLADDPEVEGLWSQARRELLGFARHLESNSAITASQIRLAVALADREMTDYTKGWN
jgi:hypothetical protein